MIVFWRRGEISESSVFIRHFSSLVRKAWITSPLLSRIMVEYSTLSGSGKIKFNKKKRITETNRVIPVHFSTRLMITTTLPWYITPAFIITTNIRTSGYKQFLLTIIYSLWFATDRWTLLSFLYNCFLYGTRLVPQPARHPSLATLLLIYPGCVKELNSIIFSLN